MFEKTYGLVLLGVLYICLCFVKGQNVTFKIERPEYNKVIFEEEAVRLSCSVSELANVDQVCITISHEKSTLLVNRTEPGENVYFDISSTAVGDSGRYDCIVEYVNTTGSNITLPTVEITLSILLRERSPECIGPSTIYEDELVNLFCYYDFSIPASNFQWQAAAACSGQSSLVTGEAIVSDGSRTGVLKTKGGVVQYINGNNCTFVCIATNISKSCLIIINVIRRQMTTDNSELTSPVTSSEVSTYLNTITTTRTKLTSPVTSSEVSQYFHTITTATATTINNNNSDNNNTIYGLMGLVGLLIVLVLILIILHLCGQKRVKAKKLKRFSTGSQHIYENPSFVNHVLGSFRRTRDSAKTSQVDDDFWSTGGKTFREEDEVASSSKSSFTSNAAGVRGKLNIEGTNNEIVIHLKSSEVETTENETKFVDPVNVDGVVDDQSHSQTLDGDNVIEHDTMNADEGDMYVDMQDTARRLMLAWPATNINESSYQGKENSDRYNNVATTSPPEYSRRESKDDTYGIHTATSSYNLPGDEIETGVNNAEEDLSALYGTIDKSKSRNRRDKIENDDDELLDKPVADEIETGVNNAEEDLSALYGTIDKSKSRKRREKIENDDDELLDKPVATQNIEVENSDLYAVINKRTRHKETVNNSSALRHKVSNSKVVERPKYAPPVPPQTSSDKLSRLL